MIYLAAFLPMKDQEKGSRIVLNIRNILMNNRKKEGCSQKGVF